MIHLIAIVTAKKGRRAELLELVKANAPKVRDEAGCLEYSPVVDAPTSAAHYGDDTYLVVEKWQDQSALAAHRTAPHMIAYASASKYLIENRVIHLLRAAD
jgi:quinol monooxygenase YgiN